MVDENKALPAGPNLAAGQYWRDMQGDIHGPLEPRDGGGFRAHTGAWDDDGTPIEPDQLVLTCIEPMGEAAKG